MTEYAAYTVSEEGSHIHGPIKDVNKFVIKILKDWRQAGDECLVEEYSNNEWYIHIYPADGRGSDLKINICEMKKETEQ